MWVKFSITYLGRVVNIIFLIRIPTVSVWNFGSKVEVLYMLLDCESILKRLSIGG